MAQQDEDERLKRQLIDALDAHRRVDSRGQVACGCGRVFGSSEQHAVHIGEVVAQEVADFYDR